ncbi:MAG: polysaccharide biosynthesis/export family protein [candidate division Zixibacteria bacterium]|nr:polysaccharide biosynthesis/export family protein [candidate division Zixibacteria bacterium]
MENSVFFSNNDKTISRASACAILILLFGLTTASMTSADESYRIGPDDVLQVSFWQDNSLDASVKVGQDGKISLNIIGEIDAAGLTTAELERLIVRQISRYNKAISQAVVRVTQYGFQKVFISGQVRNPGKYAFEKIPDLWTLINEAGGIEEAGDLTRVTIIRGGERAGEVEIVNVTNMMSTGQRSQLPKVYADDTIEIPRTVGGVPTRTISDRPETKSIFYVIGEVNAPGPLTFEQNLDLLDAVALAGGPTESADLKHATVVTKDGFRTQSVKINLNKYQQTGVPGRYFIRPEDTVILPRRKGGLFGLGSVTEIVTLVGAVSTAILLYTQLSDDGGSSSE